MIAFAFVCLALSLWHPEWRGGLVLLWLSFFIVLRSSALRRPPAIAWVVGGALVLRFGIAIVNAWLGPLPGAETDALTFHAHASLDDLVPDYRFRMNHDLYSQLLGALYFIGGKSLFTGSAASVFMFLLSCLLLVRLLDLLGTERGRVLIFVLYALLPSQLLLESVTLREAWLLCLLLLGCYYGLRFVERGRGADLLLMLAGFVAAALLHRVLVIGGMLTLAIFVAAALLRRDASQPLQRRLLHGVVAAGIAASFLAVLYFTDAGRELVYEKLKGDLLVTIENYRNDLHAEQPRSDFGVRFDHSSPTALLTSSATIYLYYLFSPFPHMVHTPLDVVAAIESALRLLLLVLSLVALWRARGAQRWMFGLLFLAWLAMTLVWASGTVCYGQAIRHHVLTNWIVMVLGGAGLAMLGRRRGAGQRPVVE